jgi:hypothetical protein
MDMVASGDFAAIVANRYLHDPPRGCRNFTLTTKTQNGSLVYLVTGQP